MGRLEGKTAIITGGNSGIGVAAAKKFVKEGANVVITARRKSLLDEVAEEIKKDGGNVLAIATDISKVEDVKAMVEETLKTYGSIDILVNNAGVLESGLKPIGSFENEDAE